MLMNSSVAHKNVFASAQKYAAVFRVRPEGVAMTGRRGVCVRL